MAHTTRIPIYGKAPPCAYPSRLTERKENDTKDKGNSGQKLKDFIKYDSSDDEDLNYNDKISLRSSHNFVDYLLTRETGMSHITVEKNYGLRNMLTNQKFQGHAVQLGMTDKVFCSQWLNNRKIVFGTKCNKLMVYDVMNCHIKNIPCLKGLISRQSSTAPPSEQQTGIHSVQINTSQTLLATNAYNPCQVAVYGLPTLDPVCIGQNAHTDTIFDLCWLDEEFLVSGSRDSHIALWRIQDHKLIATEEESTYVVQPLVIKECQAAEKVRALAFNKKEGELAVLSKNGYVHIWSADQFHQKLSQKIPFSTDFACMAVSEYGLYAVGCHLSTLLLDQRTLQTQTKIYSGYSGCSIRSVSFQGNILTIGTSIGMLMFYDVRARKYLECSTNSNSQVVLKTSHEYELPTIFTHCYDASGIRLFSAGGPLAPNMHGNYARLWQ